MVRAEFALIKLFCFFFEMKFINIINKSGFNEFVLSVHVGTLLNNSKIFNSIVELFFKEVIFKNKIVNFLFY